MVRSTGSSLGLLVVTAVVTEDGALLERVPVGVVTGLGASFQIDDLYIDPYRTN